MILLNVFVTLYPIKLYLSIPLRYEKFIPAIITVVFRCITNCSFRYW